MSKEKMPRIKQIRQKNSSSDFIGVPIGVDGLLVDMISKLDLEEELRLGGNHYVQIEDTDATTEIRQWYYTEPKGTRTVQEMKDYVTYSVDVLITNAIDSYIETSSGSQNFIITESETSDPPYIVSRQQLSGEEEYILMNLYEGDMSLGKILHQKVILIKEQQANLMTINEEVDG